MISPEHILDRGRLVLGMLFVIPLGALLPGLPGQSAATQASTGPVWVVSTEGPNPLATPTPTPQEVLANLTASVETAAPTAPAQPQGTTPAAAGGTSAQAAPTAPGEVGSEDEDTEQPTVSIPGTAPNATLAEQLRKSQSRFTPAQPTQPAASPSEGPMPVATPSVAAYPPVPGAAHLFPIVGGASFSNDWGGPRPGGRRHQGIDLFAKTGTPVVAISDGTLFKVGWNRVGGWRFWLRDAWGNEFYHAHLSAFAPAAQEGAVVKAGTVLGFVGNTGDARTTPPHVHFEIHPGGGAPIPPFSHVSAWPRL